MKPSDLGLPGKFKEFRRYPGFDQLAMATELALSDERFQILNAATGSGKSAVAVTSAHLRSGRYLVLTQTRNLEQQYVDDGLVQARIHSHRNYRCATYTANDDDGDDPEFRCSWPRQECLHAADVDAVNRSCGSVTNYAYWLSIARYSDPNLLGSFNYLILDEAHGAPTWLVDALTVTVTASRLSRTFGIHRPAIPDHKTIDAYASWLDGLIADGHARLSIVCTDRKETRKVERLLGDLVWVREAIDRLASGEYKEPWIVAHLAGTTPGVSFIPRWGSDFAERFLFRGIPHVLLTSATVTRDHARYLGIPESEMRYREAPSPFDVRRRPVIYVPTTRVDFRMSEGAKWKLYRQIDNIIEQAVVQGAGNGVIHTGSYERNTELVRRLERYGPVVVTHRKDSRDFQAQLERFMAMSRAGRFAVFASPRMQEGVNLPGILCRWQVILKALAPFDSRDPLTKARTEDPAYRNLLTAEGLKQMCGRPVRGDDDYATTIVLDDHFKHVRWSCPFEEWFRTAFREVKEVRDIRFLTQATVDGFGAIVAPVANLGTVARRPVMILGQ